MIEFMNDNVVQWLVLIGMWLFSALALSLPPRSKFTEIPTITVIVCMLVLTGIKIWG